jgi:hypothetical protein
VDRLKADVETLRGQLGEAQGTARATQVREGEDGGREGGGGWG